MKCVMSADDSHRRAKRLSDLINELCCDRFYEFLYAINSIRVTAENIHVCDAV